MMDLQSLLNSAPWDWPENAGEILLAAITNTDLEAEERLGAVELAGDMTVINDDLALALLTILKDSAADEELRSAAAISLGPALEYDSVDGELDPASRLLSERTTASIQETLKTCAQDVDLPHLVRRRSLEASVRAPQPWHADTLRAAYAEDQHNWRLTAVFAMSWIKGFEEQIIESLQSDDEGILAQALFAASRWEIDAAWPRVTELLTSSGTSKMLLLAAMDAAASIRPGDAGELLAPLTANSDEEIVDAAEEAMAMAEDLQHFDNEDEEQDESIIVQ